MKEFAKFFLIWYSQQMAIPFWVLGHVHLHFADYGTFHECLASLVMHLMVTAGFWLDWKQQTNYSTTPENSDEQKV
tara:strand:- start:248 stop:475 length:228 start_codon:yes stop_codon:yes gene_type:complete